MTESTSAAQEPPRIEADEKEPLWQRLIFMIGYWFLGHIAFSLSVLLAALQLIVVFLNKEANQELKRFSRNLIQFVWECLAYITFNREEKPFPLGKFPNVTDPNDKT